MSCRRLARGSGELTDGKGGREGPFSFRKERNYSGQRRVSLTCSTTKTKVRFPTLQKKNMGVMYEEKHQLCEKSSRLQWKGNGVNWDRIIVKNVRAHKKRKNGRQETERHSYQRKRSPCTVEQRSW